MSGLASWKKGFDVENQLPQSAGGIPPHRTDFNGIFKMLSAFAFWGQSGGQAVYSAALNYSAPCLTFYNGRLWWCLITNGPETGSSPGVVAPGSNDAVWQDFWNFLRNSSGGGSGGGGAVVTFPGYLTQFMNFYEQTPPEGWAIRNGDVLASADTAYPDLWAALQLPVNSWKLKSETAWQALRDEADDQKGAAPFFVLDTSARTIRLPDTRGDYERCAGAGTMASVGQWHGDAIRNITGSHYFGQDMDVVAPRNPSGAFSYGPTVRDTQDHLTWVNAVTNSWCPLKFDASEVVPTAAENRTRAFGTLGCVYIGTPAA
ncbi:MAG: hypothetical protein LBV79_10365 [Candidatus Adiutrix sp.]|nr:hypothetical protein [Candidatus Adiutrix sp.]